MAILNPNDLTFNPREIQSLSEAIYKKAFQNPALTLFHSVEEGIKAGKQIVLLGLLNGLAGKKKTACAPSGSDATITNTEKFWTPVILEDRFVNCWTDIEDTFFQWLTKNGIAREDLTDTDFANFVEQRIGEALIDAIWRVVWMADTAENNVGASPNPGHITAGVDKTYFNMIDGLWSQIFEVGDSLNTDRKTTTLATKNAQATYVLQAFNSTDTTNKIATETLAALKYEADIRLRDQQNLVYIVTQSVFDQYAKELRSYTNVEASYKRIEAGYTVLMFEGVPVVPVSFFDRTIKSYFDSGSKYYLPHRALLTTTDNLKVGVETIGNLSEIDPFYDKLTKQYVVDFSVSIDAKLIDDDLIQAAY